MGQIVFHVTVLKYFVPLLKQTAMKNKRALEITSKSWTSLTCFPRIEIPLISRISSPSLRRPLRSAAPPFTTRLTTTLSMSLRTVAPWWPRTDTHLQSLYRWHNKKKTLHWAKTQVWRHKERNGCEYKEMRPPLSFPIHSHWIWDTQADRDSFSSTVWMQQPFQFHPHFTGNQSQRRNICGR